MDYFWRQFFGHLFLPQLSVLLAMVALQCLVAIWAAASTQHWFWRALAVWAAIMLLIPVRALEPAWLFGLSSPLIILLIALGQRWESRAAPAVPVPAPRATSGSWQFSLLDLLLLMAIVGLWIPGILAIGRNFRPTNWLGWLASSAGLAVLAVAAYACARQPRRWHDVWLAAIAVLEISIAIWVGYPVLGAIAAAAGLVAYGYAFDPRHWLATLALVGLLPTCSLAACGAGPWMRHLDPTVTFGSKAFSENLLALTIVGTALAAVLVLVIALAKVVASHSVARAGRAVAAVALALLIGPPCIWVGSKYRQLLAVTVSPPRVEKFVTPTNHYGQILELAKSVSALDGGAATWAVVNGEAKMTWRSVKASPQLQALYDELWPLLAAPNAVPYDPAIDTNSAYFSRRGPEFQVWRGLVQSLEAEVRLAIAGGDADRATELALARVRIGDMLGRGGIVADALLAHAIHQGGYGQLTRVILDNRNPLAPERLRVALSTLQRSVAEREDIAMLLARDAQFEEQLYGWGARLENILHGGDGKFTSPLDEQRYLPLDATVNTLLQTHVAIRLFEQDQQRLPASLNELVPQYLPAIPHDPPAHPLRYRLENDRFVLYSIGWDLRDDGGTFRTLLEYQNSYPDSQWSSESKSPPLDFDLGTLIRENQPE
jgi:hypothetical protein